MAATFLNLLLKDRSQDSDKKLMQAKSNQWFPLIVQGDMRRETKTWIRLALLQWVLILLQMQIVKMKETVDQLAFKLKAKKKV